MSRPLNPRHYPESRASSSPPIGIDYLYLTCDQSMRNSTYEWRSFLFPTLAGLASAVFLVATNSWLSQAWTPSPLRDFFLGECLVGAAFGAAISVYLVWREHERSHWRIFLFMLTSVCAYIAAYFATIGVYENYPSFLGGHEMGLGTRPNFPLPIFFVGGFLGAFLVFLAALLLFSSGDSSWRALTRALKGAVAGGLLGMIGWGLGELLDKRGDQQFLTFSLFLVWQPGVALTFGLLLSREKARAAATSPAVSSASHPSPTPRRGLSRAAVGFFACVLVFIGWYLFKTVQANKASARAKARMSQALQQCLSDAPSAQNLPALQPMKIEQALILEPMGGLFPHSPTKQYNFGSNGLVGPPSSVTFTVWYSMVTDPPYDANSFQISATLQQFPDAAWAAYSAKYPPCNLFVFGSHHDSVSKFGSQVYEDRYIAGSLIYLWPSGNNLVSLRFGNLGPQGKSREPEIFKRYLEKYPSSM
jgi:MFS family permease